MRQPLLVAPSAVRALSLVWVLAALLSPMRAAFAQSDDPPRGDWRLAMPLPQTLGEMPGAVVEGMIYTGGGFTLVGHTGSGLPPVTTWFGRYDPEEDAWEARAPLPLAPHHHGMTGADGRVWLTGGYVGGFSPDFTSRQAHVYDPNTDTWTAIAPLPERRAAHFLVAHGGRLWAVGGVGDLTERMFVYDIAADEWASLPGPTPREHLGAGVIDGKIYVVGGRGFGRGEVGTLEVYDPLAETWTTLPSMPGGCGGCSTAVTADGRLHVLGGEAAGGLVFNTHWVYDPPTSTWHAATPMKEARHGLAAVAISDRVYAIGGGGVGTLLSSVEVWNPELVPATPSPRPPTNTPRPSATPAPSRTPAPTSTSTQTPDGPCQAGCIYLPWAARPGP